MSVLAGSIRDDGPLLDTITDISAAQDRYAAALASAGMVDVLSTMLHGIGVGNMLPAWVPVVRGYHTPLSSTKLADRGSSQTIGLVTDVGLFLHHLARPPGVARLRARTQAQGSRLKAQGSGLKQDLRDLTRRFCLSPEP